MPSSEKANDRPKVMRRQILVKKQLQIHFALAASVMIVVSTVAMWLIMYGVFFGFLSAEDRFSSVLLELLESARLVVVPFILADAAALFLFFIYVSRHVAGPIHRMERAMVDLLEKGKAAPIALRRHDLLKEMVDVFNEVIIRWNKMSRKPDRRRKAA